MMDMRFEYHQLFNDLLQITKDVQNNFVGVFVGRTGTLVGIVKDINYINNKGTKPCKNCTLDRLFQNHIDMMKFGLEEA